MYILKLSKDGRCQFDPKWSSFQLLDTKHRLRSWSKIYKTYQVPVDGEALAKDYAAKRGLDPVEVQAEWNRKRDESMANGTLIHGMFEHYFNTKEIPVFVKTAQEVIAQKFMREFFVTNRLVPQECELIVYSEQHDCATLLDSIVKDRSGQYYLIDWKTDKVIKDNSYGRYLKSPFNLLPDHDLMKHKLQLNFQKQLCTEYPIAGMYIGHIAETGYRLIPVEDMELNLDVFCAPPPMIQEDLPF